MTKRKQMAINFSTSAGNPSQPRHMSYFAGHTKNHSFTIWFQSGEVEYNVSPHYKTGYIYDSKYPLPIHHAIIKHYGIKDQIKKWNESHS